MRVTATLITLTAALWGTTTLAEGVKMSRAGECYTAGHPRYLEITPAAMFATLVDCQGMGGLEATTTPRNLTAPSIRTTTTQEGDHLWVDSHIQMPSPVAGLPVAGTHHPLRTPWSLTNVPCARDTDPESADVIVRQDLSTSYQYFTSVEAASPYKGGAPTGCTVSVPAGPHTYVDQAYFAERHAADHHLARQRAAFDALHGVTPLERAAGPNPAPASYPEGRKAPTAFMAQMPGMMVGVAPVVVQTHTSPAPSLYKHHTPSANLLEQRAPNASTTLVLPSRTQAPAGQTVTSTERPPIALPGAYNGATVARATQETEAPVAQEVTTVAAPALDTFVEAAADAGLANATPEDVDNLANTMEAQGIMPPGYAPGTAPDVNDMLSGQGVDPTTLPGFDGGPALMGLGGMAGASVTFGQ